MLSYLKKAAVDHNCLNGWVSAAVLLRWDCGQLSSHMSTPQELGAWMSSTDFSTQQKQASADECRRCCSQPSSQASPGAHCRSFKSFYFLWQQLLCRSDARNWSSRRWIIHPSHEGGTSWILFANTATLAKTWGQSNLYHWNWFTDLDGRFENFHPGGWNNWLESNWPK